MKEAVIRTCGEAMAPGGRRISVLLPSEATNTQRQPVYPIKKKKKQLPPRPRLNLGPQSIEPRADRFRLRVRRREQDRVVHLGRRGADVERARHVVAELRRMIEHG